MEIKGEKEVVQACWHKTNMHADKKKSDNEKENIGIKITIFTTQRWTQESSKQLNHPLLGIGHGGPAIACANRTRLHVILSHWWEWRLRHCPSDLHNWNGGTYGCAGPGQSLLGIYSTSSDTPIAFLLWLATPFKFCVTVCEQDRDTQQKMSLGSIRFHGGCGGRICQTGQLGPEVPEPPLELGKCIESWWYQHRCGCNPPSPILLYHMAYFDSGTTNVRVRPTAYVLPPIVPILLASKFSPAETYQRIRDALVTENIYTQRSLLTAHIWDNGYPLQHRTIEAPPYRADLQLFGPRTVYETGHLFPHLDKHQILGLETKVGTARGGGTPKLEGG